ncbi:cation-transporting P-type ATPase [Pelagibius sp.]|uniref:cation-transporting P-type ATPase n=1 Tax=Pelagibius sp. TaxID=1931238 RepID=UPI003BB21FE1
MAAIEQQKLPAAPAIQQSGTPSWHALTAEEVLADRAGRASGLTPEEAQARLAEHGPNRLPAPKRPSALRRFLAQFHNLLIYVLLGAAALTAALGHWVDTQVILAVAVVNAIIGFVQEGKAAKALEAIRQMLSPSATVLRQGQRMTVPAEDLVPGDLVILEPGDKVPADIRLTRVKGLRLQEAALTGESVPVDKALQPVPEEAPLGDRASMAYAGTLVVAGQAAGVVAETGLRTEIGRISGMLTQVERLSTPLLRQMNVFARWLTVAVVAMAGLVFAFGVALRDFTSVEMFMVVVGLAVAAIPEGLPAILTVTLAIGVQRMASRNAIVRRLPAIETLGSVSIICSDKTGTMTRNEMTVCRIATTIDSVDVGGVGYEPRGGFSLDGREILPEHHPLLSAAIRCALLCNDSSLTQRDGAWTVQGDPMEGALLTVGLKAGLDPALEPRSFPRSDVIPFDAEHRFMATLHHGEAGQGWIYLKGAPEQVIEICTRQRGPDGESPIDPGYWHDRISQMASQGQRVLAVAAKAVDTDHRELRFGDVEKDMTLLGLFGLIDPPRQEAVAAVAECRSAGIQVKMITGDHGETARAIGGQLGLANHRDVLTGADLDSLDDTALMRRAAEVDIFARTSPAHKLRLVQALQAGGQVVAMTGDGVNDAPALKRADVGVAMGGNGTEAAKEAAEMVLADDNFASIATAVREGRTVYDNLKKAIVFLLPVNGGESFAIIIAILLGYTLPITPLQILWVNMVSSVGLAIALAFEPTEADVMKRPPRPAGAPMLSGFLVWRIFFVSALFVSGVFGIFLWTRSHGASLEEARTYAVNTLVVMEVFYLFSVRYLRAPSLTLKGIMGTRAVLVAVAVVTALQLVFTYAPFMEAFFDTRPVDFIHGVEIICVGVALFTVLEIEKQLLMRLTGRRGSSNGAGPGATLGRAPMGRRDT